jgi:hypothetical protein
MVFWLKFSRINFAASIRLAVNIPTKRLKNLEYSKAVGWGSKELRAVIPGTRGDTILWKTQRLRRKIKIYLTAREIFRSGFLFAKIVLDRVSEIG